MTPRLMTLDTMAAMSMPQTPAPKEMASSAAADVMRVDRCVGAANRKLKTVADDGNASSTAP